jgi:hypothetical protein
VAIQDENEGFKNCAKSANMAQLEAPFGAARKIGLTTKKPSNKEEYSLLQA